MLALAGVGVFITGRAVKTVKPEAVAREMRGNPIKNYTYAAFVHNIYKLFKIIGRAVARGRGKIPRYLIPPRAFVRIFRNRHKLGVCIVHFLHIL